MTQDAASGVYFYGYPAWGTGIGHYASLGSGSFPLQGAGNSFTFMAWIYPNATTGPPVLWTLNRYNDGTGAGTVNQAIQQAPCFSDLSASGVQGFGNGAGIPGSSSSCTTFLPPNYAWTHLAFVRNGLSGSYYINGVLNSTQTAPNNVTYGTVNFTIGCDFRNIIYGTTNVRCFTGFIGSMTFLNTALSSSDILQAYTGAGLNNATSGASRYTAAAGRRLLRQAPRPVPVSSSRRLAQAPLLPPPSSPPPPVPTCLAVALLNSSGSALAPATAGSGNTAWDSTYGPLTAGNYTVVPTLLDGHGQLVSTAMPLTITLLPPPQTAPPPPPLVGAVWMALEVFVPVSSYTDLTAETTTAAAATAVSAAVVPAGGLAPASALANVSVFLDLALTWQAQGRRHALTASGSDLSAVAAAVAASPSIVALISVGGAAGPVSAQLLPDGATLRIELAGVAGTSSAAISAAAGALGPAWAAAATLPAGASGAAPAPGGAVVRLQLALQGGVTLAASTSASRGNLLVLDVAIASVAAAEGTALGAALAPAGITQLANTRELCYTAPGTTPLCAWDLPTFAATLVNALLAAVAPPGAAAGAPGAVGGAVLDLAAVVDLGVLINTPQAGNTNATAVSLLRLRLLSAVGDLVVAGSSSGVSADGIAAVAAVLNISTTQSAYQGDMSNATVAPLPAAVVAAGLNVLALLAPSAVEASAASCAALANITSALLAAAGTPGGAPALTRSSADDAIAVFAAIAEASSFPLAPGTLQAVITGLSLVAESPGAAAPLAGAAPTAYAAIGAAAAALATTAAAQMGPSCAAAGNSAGVAAQTAAANASGIGLSVSCHAPGSPADPLYAVGVSAAGGLASLAPIPPSLPLAGAPAVTVTLLTLAFDAYGAAGTGGVTVRLTFSNAATGATIPLANLSEPLTFQVATPPGGPGAVLFWDTAAGAYSAVGVVTMANPAPAGAVLSWRPGFRANSAEDLPLAWSLALPSCVEQLLNCSDAWERTLAVSLNPHQSIGDPVVACADNMHGLRRVFVGHDCPLWRPGGGSSGCGWNVSAQAFAGSGCVLDPITRAATLHTTDFYAGPAPRIELPPPAALAPPSPSELRRMAPLLIILLGLFVGMHVLALALNVRDQADMARALARSRSPALGCECTEGGLYTWRLRQSPLDNAVAGLRGSAVEFAALVGVPYSRLALALPGALFGGQPLRHATGRIGGISGTALRQHHGLLMVAATQGLHADGGASYTAAEEEPTSVKVVVPVTPRGLGLLTWMSATSRASDDVICVICYEQLTQSGRAILLAPCGHRFHVDCLQASVDVGRSTRCPLCRSQVDVLRPLGWAESQAAAEASAKQRACGTVDEDDDDELLWLSRKAANTTGPLSQTLAALVDAQLHAKSAACEAEASDNAFVSAVHAALVSADEPLTGRFEDKPRTAYSKPRPRAIMSTTNDDTYAEDHAMALASDAAAAKSFDLLDYVPGLSVRTNLVDATDVLSEPPDLLQLSSTALVQAFQATWCLVGAEDIAEQHTRYIRALNAAGVDADGAKFMRLFSIYKEMLMGPLFSSTVWIAKARLFRVVLSYDFDAGGWEASSALAVALQASDAEPPSAAAGGLQRIRHLLQALLSSLVLGAADAGGVDTAAADNAAASFYDVRRRLGVKDAKGKPDAALGKKRQRLKQRRKMAMPMDDGDDSKGADSGSDAGEGGGGENQWLDDPLHFTGAALRRSVPTMLRKVFGGDSRGASRAWATALAVAWLEQQDVSWLATDPLFDDTPRTLADTGAAAVTAQLAARCGAEAAAQLAAELAAAARPQLARWAAAADARVTAARAAHAAAPFYALSQAQRVISALLNSLLAHCSTVAMCFSLYSVGTRRYMSAFALVSGLLAALLVNVGLFWSKGAVCCGDAREALGCGRDALAGATCRGFWGSCADLGDVFVPFAAAALALPPLARPLHQSACVAFPADDSARDTFLAGLIGAAVALPVTAGVAVLFSLAVATDAGQPRAAVHLLTWPLRVRCMLGRARWRMDTMTPAAARRRSVLGRWWSTSLATDAVVAVLDATRQWPPKQPLGALPDASAGAALDAAEVRMRRAGFALMYAIWAVFAYLVVVYGRLLLRLLGPAADSQFAQSWLVALGAGQAAELRSFAVTAAEVLMVATILDALWLLPNARWLETQVDYASVQAAAFMAPASAARVTNGRRMWAYLQHFKAVR